MTVRPRPARFLLLVIALSLLLPLTLGAQPAHPDDIYWDKRFPAVGANGPVFATATRGEVVYIAGRFTEAGGIPAENVASWDRTTFSWSPLGSGVTGTVNDVVLLGDALYVAGRLTRAGDATVMNLARFDLTSRTWSSIGPANDEVLVLAAHGGRLYAGGRFDSVGGRAADRIASYDPATGTWSQVVTRIRALGATSEFISAIAFDGDDLYVGGSFDEIDGIGAVNIARRIGSTWESLGGSAKSGVNGPAWSFAFWGDSVYIGGDFLGAGIDVVENYMFITQHIVRWRKSTRTYEQLIPNPTNTDFNPGSIRKLQIAGDLLYAGGPNNGFAGKALGGLGYFPLRVGGSWFAPWDTLFGEVYDLALLGTDLVVGGTYQRAGNVAADNIALWNGATFAPLANIPDNGVNGRVYASASIGSDLYVAGDFTVAGGRASRAIARWDGKEWHAVGGGLDGTARALIVQNGRIYVGGAFTRAGSVAARSVACWDPATSSWSPLGGGLDGAVRALVADGTSIYAGGAFGPQQRTHVARWNGTTWDSLAGSVQGQAASINALAILQGGLYAGGRFAQLAGVAAANIARYDIAGGTWAPLGGGITGGLTGISEVYVLHPFGARLAVGGEFTRAGTVAANYVAYWSPASSSWSDLGPGSGKGPCNAVRAITSSGNDLYLGGEFKLAGDAAVDRAVIWDGSSWQALGLPSSNGVNDTVHTLTLVNDTLFAGGVFVATADGFANRVARYANKVWAPLGGTITSGLNGRVLALAIDGERLFAGGLFTATGTATTNYIALWDDVAGTWRTLGNGVNGEVRALTIEGRLLYVGGRFTLADGRPVRNIAVWNIDERRWSPLGGIPGNGVDGEVNAIAVVDDEVYVGGEFQVAGDTAASRVALWDRRFGRWSPLGAGIDGEVRALTTTLSWLYAGGLFDSAGGSPAQNIARWHRRNHRWERLGDGTNDAVNALITRQTSIYLGGKFTVAGVISAPHVARFDNYGGYFDIVGGGVEDPNVDAIVTSLAFQGKYLFAGGSFSTAGTTPVNNLARYDTLTGNWSEAGSGITSLASSPRVFALAGDDDELYVGGLFNRAGGSPSYNIAHWEPPKPSVGVYATPLGSPDLIRRPWPNPTRGETTIQVRISRYGWSELELCDLGGRRVALLHRGPLTEGEHRFRLDASTLASGAYLLRLHRDEARATQSIIVAR